MDLLKKNIAKVAEKVGLGYSLPPDEELEDFKRKLDRLSDMINILKKNCSRYAESVLLVGKTSREFAKDVAQFYSKSAPRQKSVQQFVDACTATETSANHMFSVNEEFGWDIVKVFDDWQNEISSLRAKIKDTDDTRHKVAAAQDRVKQLEGRSDRGLTPKDQQELAATREKLEDMLPYYQQQHKSIGTEVLALVDGRYGQFDKVFVRMMEFQISFFQSCVTHTEPFSPFIQNYRKRFPRDGSQTKVQSTPTPTAVPAASPTPATIPAKAADKPTTNGKSAQNQQTTNTNHPDEDHEEHKEHEDPEDEEEEEEEEEDEQEGEEQQQQQQQSTAQKSTSQAQATKLDEKALQGKNIPIVADPVVKPAAPAVMDIFGGFLDMPASNNNVSPNRNGDAKNINNNNSTASRNTAAVISPTSATNVKPVAPTPTPQVTSHAEVDFFGLSTNSAPVRSTPTPTPSSSAKKNVQPDFLNDSPSGSSDPLDFLSSSQPHTSSAFSSSNNNTSSSKPPAKKAPSFDLFDPLNGTTSTTTSQTQAASAQDAGHYTDVDSHEFPDLMGSAADVEKKRHAERVAQAKKRSPEEVQRENEEYERTKKPGQSKLEWTIERNQKEKLQLLEDSQKREQDLRKAIQAAEEVLSAKIDAWELKNGVRKNIRTLLTSLDSVLWAGAEWQTVSLADLVDKRKIFKAKNNAMRVVHPDKVSDKPADVQYTARRLFEALTSAYERFEQTGE